ncbi:MAG TPA: hypothetical protein VGW12_19825 [Pyrinomonadaceae bacterium]|nr:hypothetical protein [Pyrinomonadaceae bacterium]
MNCQQFTTLIVEAARERMMDAAARESALCHADACEACGARLRQEQRLTNALRGVVAEMKDVSAPARVEAQLLAAFRENLAAPQAATTEPAYITRPTPFASPDETAARFSSHRTLRRARVLTTSIAASLALVALVALYQQFTRTTPNTEPIIVSNAPRTEELNGAQNAGTDDVKLAETVVSVASQRGTAPAPLAAKGRTPARPARPAVPRMIASQQVIDGGSAIFAEGEDVRADNQADNQAGNAAKPNEMESLTEFIPLVAGAPDAQPLESGQVVRVQLPRAALASLGLPLNAERSNETVKADVLLGNDGLARAIRFVR